MSAHCPAGRGFLGVLRVSGGEEGVSGSARPSGSTPVLGVPASSRPRLGCIAFGYSLRCLGCWTDDGCTPIARGFVKRGLGPEPDAAPQPLHASLPWPQAPLLLQSLCLGQRWASVLGGLSWVVSQARADVLVKIPCCLEVRRANCFWNILCAAITPMTAAWAGCVVLRCWGLASAWPSGFLAATHELGSRVLLSAHVSRISGEPAGSWR